MKVLDFLNISKKICNEYPTRYQLGGVGQHDGNTWLFDCVGIIKSILWGFNFDYSQYRGGAIYGSNGVPDEGCNEMFLSHCTEHSTDFNNIEEGEFVWMDGHIGIYIGNRQVLEATAGWEGKVLISELGSNGERTRNGHRIYRWTHHGKCVFLDYSKPTPAPTPKPTKSIDEIAQEVIDGLWGNQPERSQKLEAAGYNYDEIQNRVNEILAGDTPAPTVDILDLVRRTIRGDFGNGEDRRNALGSNYDEVQRQVNLNLEAGLTNWDDIRLF